MITEGPDRVPNESRSLEMEGRDLNAWLPVTASRKGDWRHSAFHNVTAVVGAGVLGLPAAVSQLGWVPGIGMIAISWLITLYTLWQLTEMHEMVPGKRFDRYAELAAHAFGSKVGHWYIMPQQMFVQVATDIVYTVTGGQSLKKFIELLFPAVAKVRQAYYILSFTVLQVLLSQIPNFHSLQGVSFLATIMSFCYSTVAFVGSIIRGTHQHHGVSYGLRSHTTAGKIFDIMNALGTISFSFAAHSVVLEIQATIPSTPENPSKRQTWKGVLVAYAVVAFCYFSVAASGFWAFGSLVADNVLISLEKPRWLIAAANFMVFLHVAGGYQVYAMPVYDLIESSLIKRGRFTPGRPLRLTARTVYVALTGFIGMCVPFFGGLMGFFGGLFFASVSYFIPCMMWLAVRPARRWSFHWIASWISIVVGVSIAVLAPIGGLRQIVISAETYRMFS